MSISIIAVLVFSSAFKLFNKKDTSYQPLVNQACQDATYLFGVRIDTLASKTYYPKKGESFKTVLLKNGVNHNDYEKVRKSASRIINLNYSISGLPTTLISNDEGQLKYAVLEKNVTEYIILDIDQSETKVETKNVVTQDREVAGIIKGDLYSTFKDLDIPRNLIYQLDKVYDYTFNLYKLRNGDTIRIKYEEQLVDGVAKKATQLKACILTSKGKRYYAVYYQLPGDEKGDFYDENGNALKRSFLEKPLKYGRLSSKFNKNRLHPVLKVAKAHLGTDFAAPTGTPIIATADGVILEAASSRYNGNYVKVKHDKMYTTQYLHMSRFAKGLKRGSKVKQGQIIGYVGATGLATGPHVCYRFWKNGVQVDPFRENLKFARGLDPSDQKRFVAHMTVVNSELVKINPWNHTNIFKDAVASVATQ
ncbi:MAG TPA: peptidoglycan DD-metalloendopeptidase family protein [Chitinophagales bacterium]|nr:peptidoglycan DD-metalloendopeptidase family protein [Chitinophagales bacterium]